MIAIKVRRKDGVVNYIKISGHANFAEGGFDIICASVSSMVITTVNALISINEDCLVYTEKDGYIEVGIIIHDEIIDKLVDNLIELLTNLSKDYKGCIKFIK